MREHIDRGTGRESDSATHRVTLWAVYTERGGDVDYEMLYGDVDERVHLTREAAQAALAQVLPAPLSEL